MKRQRKQKLKALKLSDEDLERMAIVTESDIINADKDWTEFAINEELLAAAPQIETIEDDAQ
jgi:hypothetical protein